MCLQSYVADNSLRQHDVIPGKVLVARINTVAFHGVEVVDVAAQVQISGGGLPAFTKAFHIAARGTAGV